MDKKTLKECSDKILTLKQENQLSITNISKIIESLEESRNQGDDVDQSTTLSEITRNKNIKNQLERKSLMIESATRRMSSGKFGICITCEDDIPKKRLLANPLSIRCLSCQEEQEMVDKEDKLRHKKAGPDSSEFSDSSED